VYMYTYARARVSPGRVFIGLPSERNPSIFLHPTNSRQLDSSRHKPRSSLRPRPSPVSPQIPLTAIKPVGTGGGARSARDYPPRHRR